MQFAGTVEAYKSGIKKSQVHLASILHGRWRSKGSKHKDAADKWWDINYLMAAGMGA